MGEDQKLIRVNVMLSRNELLWLEKAAAQIHAQTGVTPSRSEILRAIVGALSDARMMIRGCRGERELRTALFQYLRDRDGLAR